MNAILEGSTFAGRHSMDTPEWYTPDYIVEPAREALGGAIDLDPASHPEANERIRAGRIFTEQENGLEQDWLGAAGKPARVLHNPPGGLVRPFWRKFCLEWLRGNMAAGIWIGYSLEQLQTLQVSKKGDDACHLQPFDFSVCLPRKRIQFVENEAARAERIAIAEAKNARRKALGQPLKPIPRGKSPSHANFIVYAGSDVEAFRRAFAPIGYVTGGEA